MEEQLEFDSTGLGSIQARFGEIEASQVALTHPVFVRDQLDGLWSSERWLIGVGRIGLVPLVCSLARTL